MDRVKALSLLLVAFFCLLCFGNLGFAGEVLDPGTSILAHGTKGKIEFKSFDAIAGEEWYALITGSYLRHPETISGTLTFPAKFEGKVPAVVIMHDSGGIQASHERAWAKFFNSLGYAAFVVDSFGGRKVERINRDQLLVTEESFTIDAFQALNLLVKHEDIDPTRIAVTGYSKGAIAAYYASWKYFQSRLALNGAKFAAHLPVYSWCNVQEDTVKLTGAPMLFLSGGKDTQTPAAPCARFVERAKAANVDARIIIYPNAHHSFDDPASLPSHDSKGWNSAACMYAVDYVHDKGFRPNFDEPWRDWKLWDPFWKGCFKRGSEWGYNKAAAAQAHVDAKAFLQSVLGK